MLCYLTKCYVNIKVYSVKYAQLLSISDRYFRTKSLVPVLNDKCISTK